MIFSTKSAYAPWSSYTPVWKSFFFSPHARLSSLSLCACIVLYVFVVDLMMITPAKSRQLDDHSRPPAVVDVAPPRVPECPIAFQQSPFVTVVRRDACLDDSTWASLADVFCSCSPRADAMTRRGLRDRTWRESCLGWTGYPRVPSRWSIHKYYACARNRTVKCTD